MTMLTVMTMFLIYPFTLSHEHRHHRHHRHAYSEMTLAVYYCSKQKQWYYEKHKIRMTQMTLMTLNLGYGIGISPKRRHERHQRHYRHARTVPGVWGTPQKCVCGYPNAMLAKHVYPPKTIAPNPDAHTNLYIPRVNHFWFIQKSWLEKVNPFWFTFQSAAIIPLPPRAWSSRRCSFFRERGNAPS